MILICANHVTSLAIKGKGKIEECGKVLRTGLWNKDYVCMIQIQRKRECAFHNDLEATFLPGSKQAFLSY